MYCPAAPAKNIMPVTELMTNPQTPHGSKRWMSTNEAFLMKPRMRRLPASTTPNRRDRPMKCSDSSIGHA